MQLLCTWLLWYASSILQRSSEYLITLSHTYLEHNVSSVSLYPICNLTSSLSQYYMDGGFSSFQPVVPSQTLTVSPFSGDIDICPADTTCTWDLVVSGATLKGNVANIVRMFNAIYPMTLEVRHLLHSLDAKVTMCRFLQLLGR